MLRQHGAVIILPELQSKVTYQYKTEAFDGEES